MFYYTHVNANLLVSGTNKTMFMRCSEVPHIVFIGKISCKSERKCCHRLITVTLFLICADKIVDDREIILAEGDGQTLD